MRCLAFVIPALIALAPGCSDDDGVTSDEKARQAYYGLDTMIDKAMDLGFQGYHAASSANIPAQSTSGDISLPQ